MMHGLAIFLVLTSIGTGFFSPRAEKNSINNDKREDLMVKEANRVILVEYETEARPIDQLSPPPSPSLEDKLSKASDVIDSTKKKFKEASSVLPNLGQGVSDNSSPSNDHDQHHYNAKELICDAYGKCKHKLAGVFGKAKEAAVEKVHDVEDAGGTAIGKTKEAHDKAKENMEGAEERTKEAVGKTKESVFETGQKAMEVEEVAIGKTKEAMGKAKESVFEKGNKFKEFGAEKVHKLEETGEMAMDKATEEFAKAGESVREKTQELKERTKEAEEKVRENMRLIGQDVKKGHNTLWDHRSIQTKAGGLFKEGGMNFSSICGRGREALSYAAKHAVSNEVVHPTLATLHLLGLATAYGLSVWVTFISSYVLAGTLPRQQFGIVQSKIYPVYFKALLGSIGCSLLAHILRHSHWGLTTFRAYNMLACLGLVLFNLLYLEPRATKVMFDKMKLEKEEGRGTTAEQQQVSEPTVSSTAPAAATPGVGITENGVNGSGRVEEPEEVTSQLQELNKRLKKLNTISSLLNLITLMSVTWQLVYLGRGLSVA